MLVVKALQAWACLSHKEGSNLKTILLGAIEVWFWLDRLDMDLLVEGPDLKTPRGGEKGGQMVITITTIMSLPSPPSLPPSTKLHPL